MRVTHVAPTAFGDDGLYGGGERYPFELGRALARHVDCRLITFGSRSYTDKVDGFEIAVLPARLCLKGHPAHPLARGLLSALDGADLVHCHQMRSTPSRVAALFGVAAGRPRIVTDHGLGGGGFAGLLPRLFDLFLAVSSYSAHMLGASAEKTRVVYGGVDPARFHPDPKARREGVLYVGRITPHKGLDHLIRALPHGVRLTLAGTPGHDPRPPERDYPILLEALAAGRAVRFAGTVAETELPALYRHAQVFVLPSVHQTCYGRHVEIPELLGLSMLEAMASATPVICSRVGGLPEVVRDGETGFVVEPGDVDELRDRITLLVSDRRLASRMGARARAVMLDEFTWERCAQRCLTAYEELATGAV